MTVGELIQLLSEYPLDVPIIVSSDEEGNSFALLSDVDEHLYYPDESYIDQIYLTHAELDECLKFNSGYTEEDRAPEGSIPAVVLWP